MKKYIVIISVLLSSMHLVAQKDRQALIDYSYCGYMASEQAIPMLPVKAVVSPEQLSSADAAQSIQDALDYVAALPADAQGFRGAVLLKNGDYHISKTLVMKASGVVLRGAGLKETRLISDLTSSQPLIQIAGENDKLYHALPMTLTQDIKAGATSLQVKADAKLLKSLRVGDVLRIALSPTLYWERLIVEKQGCEIQIDAPITFDVKADAESLQFSKVQWPGRIQNLGVENLCIDACASVAVSMENVRDAWLRCLSFTQLSGGAASVAATASRVSIQDCVSRGVHQASYTFYVQGSQVLCQRIQAEGGCQDFAVGAHAHGPNAFVQCWSLMPSGYSGCVESWSSGVLFDICSVSGNALRTNEIDLANAFAGWTTTNTTLWNSTASLISCVKPQVAGNNYAYGTWGQFNGRGYWQACNEHVNPWSLYYDQLEKRLGTPSSEADKLITRGGGGTSNIQDAAYQTERARQPLMMLSQWIAILSAREAFEITYDENLSNRR